MNKYISVLSAGLFALFAAASAGAQAQNPTSIPNGLPSWAYNIPDKDQPPVPKLTGTIRVPVDRPRRSRSARTSAPSSDSAKPTSVNGFTTRDGTASGRRHRAEGMRVST